MVKGLFQSPKCSHLWFMLASPSHGGARGRMGGGAVEGEGGGAMRRLHNAT